MHGQAWTWVQHSKDQMRYAGRVVEIGSYNHNGSARDLFQPISSRYIGIDVIPGRGVEYVGNITEPTVLQDVIDNFGQFDTVISTDVVRGRRGEYLATRRLGDFYQCLNICCRFRHRL